MRYSKHTSRLLAGSAIVAAGALAATAHAQEADESFSNEIIVTAQKREQSIQDVPIAVTALGGDALAANKIENVANLTGLVPGLVMRNTAGSLAAISFAMRGVNSNPSAPLQDKQIALNIDGVYIGGSRGTLGELMEVERIEVLRGPQGTLFGRNSTAGAINVVTRDPTGDMAFTQMVGVGNEGQLRTRTTIDTPQFGPFSAYVTYLHDESRGDVRNIGSTADTGVIWDRTNPFGGVGRQKSPKWVGGRNYENVFAALRFDNGGSVTATYKFDWSKGWFSGDARVTPIINTSTDRIALANGTRINIPGNTLGNLLQGLIDAQPAGGGAFGPIILNPGDRRPDVANQSFNTRGFQRVEGHSLVLEWQASDSVTLKNTFGYRRNAVFSGGATIAGLSGLEFTPGAVTPYANFVGLSVLGASFAALPDQAARDAALAGALGPTFLPGLQFIAGTGQYYFAPYEGQSYGRHRQLSDELQLNYTTDRLNLTAGLLYFEAKTRDSGLLGFQPNIAFAPTTTVISLGGGTQNGAQRADGSQKSYAAYAQIEYQLSDMFGVVAGGRWTKDEKSGIFRDQGLFVGNRSSDGTIEWGREFSGEFNKDKFTYSVGVNFEPNDDMLFYGKYSTGFLSGGIYADIPFSPEYAKSWDAGMKLDLLDRRVRFNLSAYKVDYKNAQSTTSGRAIRRPDLPIAVVELGTLSAKGIELDMTVTPVNGFMVGGTLGYTKNKYKTSVDPALADGYDPKPTGQPKWVGSVYGQYVSGPIVGDATLMLRADMTFQNKSRVIGDHQSVIDHPAFAPYEFIPSKQLVNGRIALRDVNIGGADWEFALWGKNILNTRKPIYPFQYPYFLMTTQYEEARKYGLEVTVKFGRED